ncbi:hypothetical protein QMG83_13260 [Salinibacterium sp. G-O1]|uniref:hypothetical protein n=1 Tax=Salinibacterium sp. G-O1 TaxID=3046208 RepID=UPI0024BA8C3F|nr:hypothetical protein [Salinibacterium sp. G-O1]MDJ0336194.1 hypothetical protein [Salinibacterium sp. G-O1]
MKTRSRRGRGIAVDPRLLIGLVLVVGSVAGVVAIVSTADETVQVYSARSPLSPGDRIQLADLDTSSVRLSGVDVLYLLPGDVPDDGFVLTRAVNEGELIPASAVGSVSGLRLTSLVLDVDGALAASIAPGSTVDVWSAREVSNGQFGPPVVIVSGATVVRLVTSDTIMTGGKSVGVEVLVPKARVARVLEAVSNSDAMSIVPADLPGRG